MGLGCVSCCHLQIFPSSEFCWSPHYTASPTFSSVPLHKPVQGMLFYFSFFTGGLGVWSNFKITQLLKSKTTIWAQTPEPKSNLATMLYFCHFQILSLSLLASFSQMEICSISPHPVTTETQTKRKTNQQKENTKSHCPAWFRRSRFPLRPRPLSSSHTLPVVAFFPHKSLPWSGCPQCAHSGAFWGILQLVSSTFSSLTCFSASSHPRLAWVSFCLHHSDHTQNNGVLKLHPCPLLLCHLPRWLPAVYRQSRGLCFACSTSLYTL